MTQLGNEILKVTRKGPVAILTMDFPERKNAYSQKMREGLFSAFRQLMYFDNESRAIVLTGANGAFCSGGDISEMKKRSTFEARERMDFSGQIVRFMLTGPKPIIAAVEGPAFGAGWSLTMACDYAVAAKNARFCCAFIRVGIAPDTGLLWSLAQRIGRTRAKQYMTLGTEITAERALAENIIDEAVMPGEALERAMAVAEEYAAKPPLTVGLIKAAVMTGTDSMADALKSELDIQPTLMASADYEEAYRAFLEKRKPVFRGE